jgi:hypothetical protein
MLTLLTRHTTAYIALCWGLQTLRSTVIVQRPHYSLLLLRTFSYLHALYHTLL